MQHEIFYDPTEKRLVFVAQEADATYWDDHWAERRDASRYRSVPKRSFVATYTRKYLPESSLILEGGCGLAHNSWILTQLGYRTIALDYAQETVEYLRGVVPGVNPVQGDVRQLALGTGTIDGYWSFGVIEHFYDGYQAIRDEMRRVIRPGGYLFLTFPHMSRLRRVRARLGSYPPWSPDSGRLQRFYQFALDEERVAEDFEQNGFERAETVVSLGLTGLQRDLPGTAAWITPLQKGSRPLRAAGAAVERTLRPLSSHTALLVLRRSVS